MKLDRQVESSMDLRKQFFLGKLQNIKKIWKSIKKIPYHIQQKMNAQKLQVECSMKVGRIQTKKLEIQKM
jgi:hypothetical protein